MYDQPGDGIGSAEESVVGAQTTYDESVLPENTYNLDDTTEVLPDETMAEPTYDETTVEPVAVEDIKIGEDTETAAVVKGKRTARTGVPKTITRATTPSSRLSGKKSGAKGPRKEAIVKSEVKSGFKARAKKVKGAKSEIATLAQLDEAGTIESFNDAVDRLTTYISTKEILSAAEKSELYKALSEIRFSLNKEGFNTEDHYEAVIKLLNAAIAKEKLFSSRQLKLFKGWLKTVVEEKADPTKRKKVISRAKKTTAKKSASRTGRTIKPNQKIK